MKNLEVSLRDLGIILAFGSSAGGPSVGGPANRTSTNNAIATWNGTSGNSLNDNPGFTYTGSTLTINNASSIITNPSGPLQLKAANTLAQYLPGSGITLFGGTTTNNANGVIQLISATTIAGGIGFGADMALYRLSASNLKLSSTNGVSNLYFDNTSITTVAFIGSNATALNLGTLGGGGSIAMFSNGSIGITLDTSLNTTFAGTIIAPASSTTKPGLTLTTGVSPTSPADGNFWYDGTNLKFRNGATTRTVTWV